MWGCVDHGGSTNEPSKVSVKNSAELTGTSMGFRVRLGREYGV